MPMDSMTLATSLKSAFDTAFSNTTDRDAALTVLSNNIAAAIKTMVQGAALNYTAGLTTASGGGPVTEVVPGISGFTIN